MTNELTLMQQININTSKHSQTNQIKITRKCNIKTTNSKQTSAGTSNGTDKKVLKQNQSDTIPNVTRYRKKTNINPKPNTNMRSDERTHPHAANQHQHIKTQ